MIRQLAIGLALFLTPFAVYATFLWATRQEAAKASAWSFTALTWLTVAALLLLIVGFAVLVESSRAPPGATFVPAHIEDGRLVPGAYK
jgi:hypothetical protein